MPGHTPEERVKNDVAAAIQPGPDQSGGAGAVQDDGGFKERFQRWEEFLSRPDVRAGLLQFSAQILQPQPGGFGPAFGQALAGGLGAAGRVTALERQQGLGEEEREREAAQLQLENELAERRVSEEERRGGILERGETRRGRKTGTADKTLEQRRAKWEETILAQLPIGGPGLTPGRLEALISAGIAAEDAGDIERLRQFNASAAEDDQIPLGDLLDGYATDPEAASRGLRRITGEEPIAPAPTGGGVKDGGPAPRPPITERTSATETDRQKDLLRSSVNAALQGTDSLEAAASRIIALGLADELELLADEFPDLLAAVQAAGGAGG